MMGPLVIDVAYGYYSTGSEMNPTLFFRLWFVELLIFRSLWYREWDRNIWEWRIRGRKERVSNCHGFLR